MPTESPDMLVDNYQKLALFYQQYWLEQKQAKQSLTKFLRKLALRKKRKRTLLAFDDLLITEALQEAENKKLNIAYTK